MTGKPLPRFTFCTSVLASFTGALFMRAAAFSAPK
jgi:hypothetical protein